MAVVGVFGGSFNPVHCGHVMLASYLAQYASLDEVWLTVTPINPLKAAKSLIDNTLRLDMARLAVAGVSCIEVCDAEMSLSTPSYTINTLEYLKRCYPDKQFRLIIGSDNWMIFHKWRDYKRIIDEFGVIVYPRPGYPIESIDCPKVEFVDAPVYNLSSTFVREGIAAGKDMRAFLPHGVYDYILEHNLYQK